jgi:hypothetical protein
MRPEYDVALRRTAKVAPFAAGSEGVVRKSAAGEFCRMD